VSTSRSETDVASDVTLSLMTTSALQEADSGAKGSDRSPSHAPRDPKRSPVVAVRTLVGLEPEPADHRPTVCLPLRMLI